MTSQKFESHIIHEHPGDYLKVKHLVLKGTNEDIGYRLGEIARFDHHIARTRNKDILRNNIQKKYLEEHYPVHYDRMKGLAKAYSENIGDTEYDFSCFGNPLGVVACSAIYYPPGITESRSGILSRNLDLPTISFRQIITGEKDGLTPATAHMYVIEQYPDKGYPSMVNLSFELYGLALDGMNSEGLAVTHLYADAVHPELYNPAKEYGVGINEMLTVQFLLDTCRNVEEAKQVLLMNKHFYMLLPTHFLIADRYGKSFVWEHSPQHNREIIIDGKSEAQVITNFLIHEYPDMESFPESKDRSCPFYRYSTLKKEIENSGILSRDRIKEINSQVFITDDMFEEKPQIPQRTIYHSIFDTKTRSMEISYYRKDLHNDPLRTGYFKFRLQS